MISSDVLGLNARTGSFCKYTTGYDHARKKSKLVIYCDSVHLFNKQARLKLGYIKFILQVTSAIFMRVINIRFERQLI